LTEKGRSEALALRPNTSSLSIDVVLVSPLSRATETALLAFGPRFPHIALECLREQSGKHVCDQRRSKRDIQTQFPHLDVSLLVDEEDSLWTSERETKMELARRCEQFLGILAARPESHIAVVTHSSFLLTLFSLLFDCPPDLKQWFNTGELRSVCLELAV